MALSNFQKFLEEKKAGNNGGFPTPKVASSMDSYGDLKPVEGAAPGSGGQSYPKGVGKEFSDEPKGEKNGKGLGEEGNSALKYNPATPYKSTVNLKPVKDSKKLKSEAFVDATKNLSPNQFAAFMAKKNTNLGEVHEAVGRFTSLVKSNPSGVLALVSEARRNGYFRALMAEMLQHPEAMQIIAKLLGDKTEGLAVARRLVKAMNEMVGPPMHQTLGAGAPPHPHKKGLPAPAAGGQGSGLGGPDDAAPGDDDDMGDDSGLDDDDSAGLDDPDAGSDDDDAGLDDGDDSDGDDGDDGDDSMGDPTAGGDEQGNVPPFNMKLPRPSMMHRMMRPESTSLAVQNFMQALNS